MCGDRVGKQTLEANAEQISVCVCPWPCHIACFAESDRHATNMIKKILLFSKVRYACGSWNSVSTEIARARAPAARRREARSRRKAREIRGRKNTGTVQCFMSGSFHHMQERRLASFPFKLQLWDPDDRLPATPPTGQTLLGRRYSRDELDEHEMWLAETFEPVREQYFLRLKRGPLQWYLPAM